MTKEEKAEILLVVSEALRSGFVEGYRGHGGPQDGADVPDSFNPHIAADFIESKVDELMGES